MLLTLNCEVQKRHFGSHFQTQSTDHQFMQKQYKRKQTNMFTESKVVNFFITFIYCPFRLLSCTNATTFKLYCKHRTSHTVFPISVHSKLASFISRQESFLSYQTRLSRRANALLGCCVSLPAAACKSFGTPIHSCQGMCLLLLLQPKHALHAFSLTTIQVRQLESST